MSKAMRKKKPSKKQTKLHKQKAALAEKKHGRKNFVVWVVIAILAAIPFGLGKYIEFNSPGPYDSGGYVYSAKHILDGAKIGVEEKPSAAMGTLLVNIAGVWLCGFNETGPKMIQTILQATALLLMFITMRKLFGTLAGAVGVIVASIYLSAPLIAKFGNVKEQYMIAFAVIGISCFVLYQLNSKWWISLLPGAFLIWAPLFKPTGLSAIGAIALFVIIQPLLGHRNWKQTSTNVLLMLAGAAISIAPVYLWLATIKAPVNYWPYSFIYKPIASAFGGSQADTDIQPAESETDESKIENVSDKQTLMMKLLPGYVSRSWQAMSSDQKKQAAVRVLRYYKLLILPILLAIGSIIARLIRMIMRRIGKLPTENKLVWAKHPAVARKDYDRFVLLFAVWWLLDMAFIWVSPRSYEQYYLPLNASAAMLGGYLIALYTDKFASSVYKSKWLIVGLIGLICMIAMSWHIFLGIEKSPHSGVRYKNPDRGYLQRLEMASNHAKGAKGYWQLAGEYVRDHSAPSDKIYVWGWYPGIYVKAQRLSPTPRAFEGTMHTLSPKMLSQRIDEILSAFEKQPPKFIIDTHKMHFPWDRPPLELWPRTKKGFLPANKRIIDEYDAAYSKWLRDNIDEDEALRYKAMQPFREFVMKNYKIVQSFGQHVLFEWK
jgi:hypothetical protein